MKLLVSVVNPQEVSVAVEGGAHVIDVKNPTEGTFGANFPHLIRAVRALTPTKILVSATIGDLPNLPGTASLAALGATVSGADYVKAGLHQVTTQDEAIQILAAIKQAVKDYNPQCAIIAAGYADYKTVGCIDPRQLVNAARETQVEGVLVDIATKHQKTIFDFLSSADLESIISQAHDGGLIIALAGGLQVHHVNRLRELNCDIMGIRRAACTLQNGNYQLTAKNVLAFTKALA